MEIHKVSRPAKMSGVRRHPRLLKEVRCAQSSPPAKKTQRQLKKYDKSSTNHH